LFHAKSCGIEETYPIIQGILAASSHKLGYVTSIRLAVPEDARAIATIHVEASQAAYRGIIPDEFLNSFSIDRRESEWRQRLLRGNAGTWVAQEAGAIVGWILAAASRDTDAGASTGEIWAVYVLPGYWGRRIGRLLCETAVRHLLTEGFTEVTLWVLTDNE